VSGTPNTLMRLSARAAKASRGHSASAEAAALRWEETHFSHRGSMPSDCPPGLRSACTCAHQISLRRAAVALAGWSRVVGHDTRRR
jgi:hypothetical protein